MKFHPFLSQHPFNAANGPLVVNGQPSTVAHFERGNDRALQFVGCSCILPVNCEETDPRGNEWDRNIGAGEAR
jgi:hypothetical protein